MVFGEILAGFIATAVMTVVMVYLAPMMKMMPKDWNMITDGLGGMMNKMMGVPKTMGWVAHFMVGMIIHPYLYGFVAFIFTFAGVYGFYVYVLIFAVMMIMMFPMLGIPEDFKTMMMMGVIIVHLIYGATYLLAIQYFAF